MQNFFELPQFKCLENLVGISRKTCDCLPSVDTGKRELISISESGLFIDEHDGAVGCLFLKKADCFEGDIFDKLIWARREAILQMILDISVVLNNRFSTQQGYYKDLGETSHSSLLNLQDGKVGFSFKTKNLSGAKIQFSKIGFLAKILGESMTSTIRVTVSNKTKNQDLKVFDFDFTNRNNFMGKVADSEKYELPVFFIECDGSEYEISYTFDSSKIMVYDNKLVCSCQGVRERLKQFYEPLPIGSAYGLTFETTYICDENYLLCALSNSNTTLRFLICEAIRCHTMFKFLNNMKFSAKQGLTVSNLLDLNNHDELIGSFSLKYSQTIEDIKIKTESMGNFGCFTCNEFYRTQRVGINVSDPFFNVPIVPPEFYNFSTNYFNNY